jgi:hypothetical protein
MKIVVPYEGIPTKFFFIFLGAIIWLCMFKFEEWKYITVKSSGSSSSLELHN